MAKRRTSRRLATRTSRPIKANAGKRTFPKVRDIPVGARVVRWLDGKIVIRGKVLGHKEGRTNSGRATLAIMILEDSEPKMMVDVWGEKRPNNGTPYLDGEGIALETSPSRVKRNVGWKPADELRRASAFYEQVADGMLDDEPDEWRSLVEDATAMEREASYIEREGRPLTAEEWLGGAEIRVPVDVRHAENELFSHERAADDAAPRWRPGFEPHQPPKRTSRRVKPNGAHPPPRSSLAIERIARLREQSAREARDGFHVESTRLRVEADRAEAAYRRKLRNQTPRRKAT